jgi:hypothetical protein
MRTSSEQYFKVRTLGGDKRPQNEPFFCTWMTTAVAKTAIAVSTIMLRMYQPKSGREIYFNEAAYNSASQWVT